GFTDGEEEEVGLTKVVPFLVEDELMGLGAIFSKVKNWAVHTVSDGQLITGQNPASSGPTAKVLLETLDEAKWGNRASPELPVGGSYSAASSVRPQGPLLYRGQCQAATLAR